MTTITTAYREQQQLLHRNPKYGSASLKYAPLVRDILRATGYRSLCDYGAGKCRLGGELRSSIRDLEYHPYDPAFPDYGPPVPAQVVTCIDVLEHIEPELLDNVIAELAALTERVGFFTVHCGPAKKVLSDGRNAHLIQQPIAWWLERFLPHFDLVQLTPVKNGFWVLVQKKGGPDHSRFFAAKRYRDTLSGRLKRAIRRLTGRR